MAPRRSARLAALAASKNTETPQKEDVRVICNSAGSRRVVLIQKHVCEYPCPAHQNEMSTADVLWLIVTWFLLICCVYSFICPSKLLQ